MKEQIFNIDNIPLSQVLTKGPIKIYIRKYLQILIEKDL